MSDRELTELEINAIDFLIQGMVRDTLVRFEELANEYQMDRRSQTLMMYKFATDFAAAAWHGKRPQDVLIDIARVAKEIGR